MATARGERSWVVGALRRGLEREPKDLEVQAGETYHTTVLHSMDRKRKGLMLLRVSGRRLARIIIGEKGIAILTHEHTYDHELE